VLPKHKVTHCQSHRISNISTHAISRQPIETLALLIMLFYQHTHTHTHTHKTVLWPSWIITTPASHHSVS